MSCTISFSDLGSNQVVSRLLLMGDEIGKHGIISTLKDFEIHIKSVRVYCIGYLHCVVVIACS